MAPVPEHREFHCPVCASPQKLLLGKVHTCDQCGAKDRRLAAGSSSLSFIFSLTAFIFYVPANFLPFMTIELYGTRQSSTIWSGIVSLMDEKSYLIAMIVFLASILIPVLKLLILLYLSFPVHSHQRSRFKMSLYHFVEAIGRWSMLDIFLLAVLVAMVKLGKLTTVQPEIGSTMFALVVIFTLLASNYFDPRILWEKKNESHNT